MKYAFASRTGNVEEIISSLGIDASMMDLKASMNHISYLHIQMDMAMFLLKSKAS